MKTRFPKPLLTRLSRFTRRSGPVCSNQFTRVVLAHELKQRGLRVERQVAVPVVYEGVRFDEGYRLDLMVCDKVIVEIKSVEAIKAVHKKQLLTYLKLMDKRLGLLINFNEELIKTGISRVANGLI